MTLGAHQRCVGKSQNHITPKWLLDALGPFDLDPCAAEPRPWECARINWTSHGLDRVWFGLVYVNPPFNRYEVGAWISKLAQHRNGITLLHARTEAAWFEPIWQQAAAILFMADRIHFHRSDGSRQPANSGAPPILAAFGNEATLRLHRCGIAGALSWKENARKAEFTKRASSGGRYILSPFLHCWNVDYCEKKSKTRQQLGFAYALDEAKAIAEADDKNGTRS